MTLDLRTVLERLRTAVGSGNLDAKVTSITYDSRKAGPGVAFVALRGVTTDGHDYIEKALEAGCAAIVAETAPPEICRTAWLHVKDSRVALAEMASLFYGNPSQQLSVAAVTGTNGKTTTAFLLHHLLNHAQRRCGLLGTVVYDVGGGSLKNATHTTPESLELQGLLAEMRGNGCRAVAMEASSHALAQHRTHGVDVHTAIYTNFTQDHLDYHGTMEEYFKAKASLFETTSANPHSHLVINIDDVWGRRLQDRYKGHAGLVTYGLGAAATFRAVNPRYDLTGSTFELEYGGRSLLARIPLIGQFNVYNTLAALAASHAMGCNLRDSVRAMQTAPQVPGRMERVTLDKHPFHVFVDYAHTPDGLTNALSTARALRPGRLITVFGCGGDRDRFKRPQMARAVEEQSDITILTSDNPRSEDPQRIIQDAAKGFQGKAFTAIVNRKEAIQTAIKHARPRDIIVIAGKGHEDYQDVKGVKQPFDDRKIARMYVDMENRIKGEKRLEARQRRDDEAR